MEKWKPVKDYPDYDVSTLGRVRSHKRGSLLILKGSPQRSGHLVVSLVNEEGRKTSYVHVLVATAFLPNPNRLPFVLHRDDDPSNNKKSNLRWGTPQGNAEDRVLNGRILRGADSANAVLTDDQVREIRRLRAQENLSFGKIAARFGISDVHVMRIVNRTVWAHI